MMKFWSPVSLAQRKWVAIQLNTFEVAVSTKIVCEITYAKLDR